MFLEFFSKTVCPCKEQKKPQYHNQYKPHKTTERALHKKSGKQSQKAALFATFVPLQRKTQCLWQTKIAKALWHQKSHVFPKTVSQSPNSACAEFGNQTAGSIGVRSTARRKRAYYPRILPCRILGFWHKAVAQETAVPVPKRSCRPSDSEWRHPGAVVKVSLILSHKDLPGLEYKPPAMRKPNQDSSIKNPANSPRIRRKPNSGVLCLCREKRSVCSKPGLQRQPKRWSE